METIMYQAKAMMTKMPTCDNHLYMLGLLQEEAGELQGKFNKAVRKGLVKFNDNQMIFSGNFEEQMQFEEECRKELGDVCWAVAGICEVFGWELADVMQGNLDKLADRKKRGVIIGEGDNR
jgi:NTP pyrophosphatase (non-canonical NTP hydrolase)